MIKFKLAKLRFRLALLKILHLIAGWALARAERIHAKQMQDITVVAGKLMVDILATEKPFPAKFSQNAHSEFRGPVNVRGDWLVHVTDKATGGEIVACYETEEMANDALSLALKNGPMTMH